ncbi:hypothetical protein Enr13x_73890 [Stieleria neptunia]|uniref:Uncharacterized protein n=1 Tax=Stieleria neptunia TaxID=2527979 RepID=A0A518I2Y8_9BACT|nr:hypothetical protein [Stieleria neptunia]QDV47480.1 hypothetical protein Enr13x_73890 [Stieleria neptunia]
MRGIIQTFQRYSPSALFPCFGGATDATYTGSSGAAVDATEESYATELPSL